MAQLVDCPAGPPGALEKCQLYTAGAHNSPTPKFESSTRGAGEQVTFTVGFSADQVTATELAGEPITAAITEAPAGGAIGGLRVSTESAWFAARPSGTEDVYKIYAESFRGDEHLAQVQDAAKALVDDALSS